MGDPEWARNVWDAVETAFGRGAHWVRSEAPPFNLVQQPSGLAMLWSRVKAGATTEADRSFLATLPPGAGSPEEVVEMLASIEGREFSDEEIDALRVAAAQEAAC